MKEYWPELLGAGIFIALPVTLLTMRCEVDRSTISSCASLTAQVMATVLGLILTAYVVFHGMRVGDTLKTLGKSSDRGPEVMNQIEDLLDDVHESFVKSIFLAGIGAFSIVCMFFVSTIQWPYIPISNDWVPITNDVSLGLMLAIVTTSMANLISAVNSLFHLKGLEKLI